MDRLYDVALDEAAGGKSSPDLVKRVELALEIGGPTMADDDILPPARWWFRPFLTAAASVAVLLAGYFAFTQMSHDGGVDMVANHVGNANTAPASNESQPPHPVANYAIVRSVDDIRGLGDDVVAIQCDGVGAAEIGELSRRAFPKLTQLQLVRGDFDDRALDQIVTLATLTDVAFEECNAITSQSIAKLGGMQRLKTLAFVRCEKISEADVTMLRAARPDMTITVDTGMAAEPPND